MNRKHDGHLFGEGLQRLQRLRKLLPVHESRAVERDDEVRPGRKPKALVNDAAVDPLAHRHERVDHRVAHVVNRLDRAAFANEVLACLWRVDEQQIGYGVGQDAVDLLGHRAVERAQPRLDVADSNAQLGRHDRGGERRVDIAGNEHDVRPPLQQHGLEPLHDARCRRCMGASPDVEPDVGLANPEFVEEHLRHGGVVMLTGMDERVFERLGTLGQSRDDRRDLHEVGTGADDRDDAATAVGHRSNTPLVR